MSCRTKRYILILSLLTFVITGNASSPLKADKLTTEYEANPLGIDVLHPRLSWTLISGQRAQKQSAYELLVSDKESDIRAGRGTIWASGKVTSSQSLHIEYEGAALRSFTKYYWSVKVYDTDGETSGWSPPATFETAMLTAADWKAKWISDGSPQFKRDEDFYNDDPMPLLKKIFSATKGVASARLYISGIGYYEACINGKKVGDRVLEPGFTTYKKEVQYSTYDVTSLIRNGVNNLGVMLGNGWYNPLPLRLFGRFNLRDVQQTGRPCVKTQMLIRYTDGSTQTVVSDDSWLTSPGPVIRNNVYLGEHYDARLEKASWFTTETNGWNKAVVVEGPSGILTSQMQPPIRITKLVKPLRIYEAGRDTFIVDMGQNFSGVARIKVKGDAGRKISLRYGEDVFKEGRLNYLTTVAGHIKEIWNLKGGPGSPKTAWQQDSYILKGSGVEIWSPRFTFHGFRYVEITGWPGIPTLADIEGLRMNSDVAESGNFACSNDMLNQLNDVVKWTFLSNLFSVQSDCPGREKMGYGADIVVTTEAYMYNYHMAHFYRKTVGDFANEQQPDGGITEIAPYTGIADRGYGGESGPLGWQLAFPFVQKKLYEFYGDKDIIRKNYGGIKKQIAFLESKAVNGLFHWDISDHESLEPIPEAFSASCFYYHHVLLAAEFAAILKQNEDSAKYTKLADRIKGAIVRKYLIPNTGRFDLATQATQLFALWYNLSPDKEKTAQVLSAEFARHKDHVSTGIFATKFMFDFLREANQNEMAYKIATQKDYPGWGYMLQSGATTLWESWRRPDQNSQNHPMFGSVSEWFYRSLLGINAAVPGFEKIIIKPQPAGDLTWAKGSYQSVRGSIVSSWKKSGNQFRLEVSIPANTTAEIWIPATPTDIITESERTLQNQNLEVSRYQNGYAVINIGSGSYAFTRK